MENQEHLPEEEIINPEQFQVGRNPEEQDEEANQNGTSDSEQVGYTPGETEFADGEGTRLEWESEELKIDQETDDDPESDSEDDSQSGEEDADFENPDDDPA
ncbi:hypothetical protein [Pedobacter steynii]